MLIDYFEGELVFDVLGLCCVLWLGDWILVMLLVCWWCCWFDSVLFSFGGVIEVLIWLIEYLICLEDM